MQQSNSRNGSTIQRDSSYFASSSGFPYMTARGFDWACSYDASAMARSALCSTPCSCMNRLTFIAKRWAGDMTPYGTSKALSPDTVGATGPWPKRSYCPCANERNTTTQSAMPAEIAAAAFADSRRAAATPSAPLHQADAQLVDAESRGETRRVRAIVAVGGEAVDAMRIDAGVLAGRQDCGERQLEFGIR